MKFKVRIGDVSSDLVKDVSFYAGTDVHAFQKIIHTCIAKIPIVEDINTYPVKTKPNTPETELIKYPNTYVDAVDYIKQHNGASNRFIFNLKNLTTGEQLYPEVGYLIKGAIL